MYFIKNYLQRIPPYNFQHRHFSKINYTVLQMQIKILKALSENIRTQFATNYSLPLTINDEPLTSVEGLPDWQQ